MPAYCLLCAGPPSLTKNNTTCTSRLNLDHVWPPRDHSKAAFDRDGGGAGIWPAVCRPTRHHDGHPAAIAHWFSTRMVGGRHVFRCVLSRARAHLAHSGRAPNVARLARLRACGTLGASGARSASGAPEVPGTLGPQGCLAHLARLARVAHLAPASRTWGRCWFPIAAHPKTAAEHDKARVLLMCWEGGWE